MVWYGVVWYGRTWHGVARCGVTCPAGLSGVIEPGEIQGGRGGIEGDGGVIVGVW